MMARNRTGGNILIVPRNKTAALRARASKLAHTSCLLILMVALTLRLNLCRVKSYTSPEQIAGPIIRAHMPGPWARGAIVVDDSPVLELVEKRDENTDSHADS